MALTFMAIVAKAAMSNRSADDMSTIRCRDRTGVSALVMSNGLKAEAQVHTHDTSLARQLLATLSTAG